MILLDPTTLDDADLDALARACYLEQQARRERRELPDQIEALTARYEAAGGDKQTITAKLTTPPVTPKPGVIGGRKP